MNLHSSTLPPNYLSLRRRIHFRLRFPPLLTPQCNGSNNVSTRGWSGALPKETQSFPTPKDVRRASCQVRCPERNKEIIDDLPLFVSPCVLSTSVNLMQECDNKVVQKSASSIFLFPSSIWELQVLKAFINDNFFKRLLESE